jgi:uncharacterized membrane protein
MDQKQINDAEWRNPENWSGPKWASFYFSKRDKRTWVPKAIPSLGWTINIGKHAGAKWLCGFLIGIPVLFILILLFVIFNLGM